LHLPQVLPDIGESPVDFVWRTLRRLGAPAHLLDDLTQEVLLVAVGKLSTFEGRSSFKTWLYGIAFHVARRSWLASYERRAQFLDTEPADTAALSQEQALSQREAIETLYSLLNELEHDQRTVFVLCELEQLSAPEVAQITGAALGTVYSRLRAARHQFELGLKRVRARDEWRQP
jgi:RNA polymerase sigma-70 factor (ECF subfamily)